MRNCVTSRTFFIFLVIITSSASSSFISTDSSLILISSLLTITRAASVIATDSSRDVRAASFITTDSSRDDVSTTRRSNAGKSSFTGYKFHLPQFAGVDFCATHNPQCCEARNDDCSVPIVGTLCYCDEFCDRVDNPDCCPDFLPICKGLPYQFQEGRPEKGEFTIVSTCY